MELVIATLQFDDDAATFFVQGQHIDTVLDVFRRKYLLADQKQLLTDLFEECVWAVADELLQVVAFSD